MIGIIRRAALHEEALQWVQALENVPTLRGLGPPELVAWLDRSPRHVEAFLEAARGWYQAPPKHVRERVRCIVEHYWDRCGPNPYLVVVGAVVLMGLTALAHVLHVPVGFYASVLFVVYLFVYAKLRPWIFCKFLF